MNRLSQSPTDPGFVQNPYPFYDLARAAGDFVHWEDYGMSCATTHRAVQAVLKDRRMGRKPPPGLGPEAAPHTRAFYDLEKNSLLSLEPPEHTRLRGLVLRAFTSRRIRAMEGEIAAFADELATALPRGEPFDLIPSFCNRLPVIVIARLLGVPEAMSDDLLNWSNTMVAMYQARRSAEVERAANHAAAEFADFLRGYVDERRSRPADDLITHLIAAEEDGERLSPDEMISTCVLLLNAGHEATVHTLGNGVATAIRHGARSEWFTPQAAPATVEEIMRYDPPLHLFTRWVYEPVELFGHTLEPGTEVGAMLGSAGRDPALCDRPDTFDPARKPTNHMALGAGIHFCVGAPLARVEMAHALTALFRHRPDLSLAEGPRYGNVYHFHGLSCLMVS